MLWFSIRALLASNLCKAFAASISKGVFLLTAPAPSQECAIATSGKRIVPTGLCRVLPPRVGTMPFAGLALH